MQQEHSSSVPSITIVHSTTSYEHDTELINTLTFETSLCEEYSSITSSYPKAFQA